MARIAASSSSRTWHRASTRWRQAGMHSAAGRQENAARGIESSAAFKNGQRFRAGIEGRISVLFRGRGMKRCLAEGRDRFELWVGAAVLANNLIENPALLTGSVASQNEELLDRHADPLPGRSDTAAAQRVSS